MDKSYSDNELAVKLQEAEQAYAAGDNEPWCELLASQKEILTDKVLKQRWAHSHIAAEDIVADTLGNLAINHINRFPRAPAEFRAYVSFALKNAATDRLRRMKREEHLDTIIELRVDPKADQPIDLLEIKAYCEHEKEVMDALKAISPPQEWQAFEAVFLNGQKQANYAHLIGKNIGTVSRRIQKTRDRLLHIVEDYVGRS